MESPPKTTPELIKEISLLKQRIQELEQSESERKRAEDALRRSEMRYRTLHESLRDAFVRVAMDGRIIDFNDAYCQMLGYSSEEMRRLTYQELTPEHWHAVEEKIVQEQIIARGYSDVYEKEYRRKDGTIIPVELRTILSRDLGGQPSAMWGIVRDTTERKRAEKALKEAHDSLELRVKERTQALLVANTAVKAEHQRLYDVLETLPVYVILLTPDYRVPFANRSFRERFGEAHGMRCYEYLFNRTEPCDICETYSVIKTNASHHWEWTGPDERDYNVYDYPFVDSDGSTLILEMGIDITQQKEAQKALGETNQALEHRTEELQQAYQELVEKTREKQRLEDQLRQAQKMEAVGTLAGGIAHDFNNILAAILGFTEMAVEDVADRPEVGRSLQNVLKSALRARELVKQILAFSRKTNYERSPLALTPLLKETVQLLRASIPTTIEIRLTTTASSDIVLASPVEVQQVLMNLATNASLAMREKGGTMEVSLTQIDFEPESPVFGIDAMPGEYLQLAVKDTGVGMSPDVMRRVFEPFFTTREVGKGTGMGLAVVYGIVKDLQGVVTVESEPGIGSTFRALLPKVKTTVEKENVPAMRAPTGTERILFVDDEEMLIEWGLATLERLGYTVTAITDSRKALNIFSSDPSGFDMVITDQTMSEMTGVQLAKALLGIRPDIPIILCTGHSETVSPEIAKTAGIREFLMKPLAKQELANAVRLVLDRNDV